MDSKAKKYMSPDVYDDFDKLCFLLGIHESYWKYTIRQVFNFAIAYADKRVSNSMAFIMDYVSIKGSTSSNNTLEERVNALYDSVNIENRLPVEKKVNGKSRIIGINEWLKMKMNG